jgi:hypothetical protein
MLSGVLSVGKSKIAPAYTRAFNYLRRKGNGGQTLAEKPWG